MSACLALGIAALSAGTLRSQAAPAAEAEAAPINWTTQQDHQNMKHFIAWASQRIQHTPPAQATAK